MPVNYIDLTNRILQFIKYYYKKLLNLKICSLDGPQFDETLLRHIQKKPESKEDCPNCLDIYPELFLAYGSEAQRLAPLFLSSFPNSENQGLLHILNELEEASFLGEETGYLFLDNSFDEMTWPRNNNIHIWVDPIDGSKRMEEALKQREETLEKAIKSLLKEKPEYNLITNSPSTGITIVYNGKIIFSIGLNLFTGEAIGSYYNGSILIPFYVQNILDFSAISDLQKLSFSEASGLNFLCYNGNKGYGKQEYQKNLEQTGLSDLQLVNGYTTGPLRIAYLLAREEIKKLGIQIIGSNREKLHDMGNSLVVGLSFQELVVYVAEEPAKQKNNRNEDRIILPNSQLNMQLINSLDDPRFAKTTFAVYHQQNTQAQEFFNQFVEQGKGYILKN